MKVRLLRDARIKHSKGETVEVSPQEFLFLVSVGSAEPLDEVKKTETAVEDTTAAEVPEKKRQTRKPKK